VTIQDLDGLVLESKYGELQYILKGPIVTNWSSGLPRQEPKEFVFQFDRYVCEIGEECRRMELTDEDKEYVVRQIERHLKDPDYRSDLWIHEPPKIDPPWPTYEGMHHNSIPGFAQQAGMVEEALLYEQRRPGGPRESVLRKLEELAETAPPVTEDDFAAV